MVADVVTIWNMALTATGGRGSISSEAEQGREADLCRLWYPTVRALVQKAAPWPSTTNSARLALLAERDFAVDWAATDPAPRWKYAYATPADMIAPLHLSSFARFSRALYDGTPAIMCSEEDALLTYMQDNEVPSQWDVGLTHAIVTALAAKLAMPLTGKRTLFADLKGEAVEAVLLARTDVANESDDFYTAVPTWIAARGYGEMPHSTRFFWPLEDVAGILT